MYRVWNTTNVALPVLCCAVPCAMLHAVMCRVLCRDNCMYRIWNQTNGTYFNPENLYGLEVYLHETLAQVGGTHFRMWCCLPLACHFSISTLRTCRGVPARDAVAQVRAVLCGTCGTVLHA